jgi:hypothetical protein
MGLARTCIRFIATPTLCVSSQFSSQKVIGLTRAAGHQAGGCWLFQSRIPDSIRKERPVKASAVLPNSQ